MTQWWRLHYVKTTSATSFGRNEDVIIALCARWNIEAWWGQEPIIIIEEEAIHTNVSGPRDHFMTAL